MGMCVCFGKKAEEIYPPSKVSKDMRDDPTKPSVGTRSENQSSYIMRIDRPG